MKLDCFALRETIDEKTNKLTYSCDALEADTQEDMPCHLGQCSFFKTYAQVKAEREKAMRRCK